MSSQIVTETATAHTPTATYTTIAVPVPVRIPVPICESARPDTLDHFQADFLHPFPFGKRRYAPFQ